MSEKVCSELFEDAFDSGVGGCVQTCECGITYFDSLNSWDWEEGELENLLQRAKEQPDKFVECDHTIGTLRVDGKDIVYNCSCGIARRYEDFILCHARQIARYLNKYVAELREKVKTIEVTGEL